ncbi:flagellar hook-associated protein FlgL [Paractinoplanes durhamensis]|uniref:Flagellar hook-associated protein FlgL n=1 Tax=Paractinoplanes durhamensis TaxID=113563 RepID=A0ABQ3YPZ0_9ACTN|nr:flagellar hook-associated protein FlgL [Actinoplanes durhamensis]GID99659.1 flagellar hook-associated protein FlgL [Actinoplanes durhamensis]
MTISSRVTETSMTTKALGDLQRSLSRGQKLQSQISSGKLLTRPSDSPTGTVTSLQLRGEVRATQQYSRNSNDGLGWLGTIQDSLGDASSSIIRIRDLTIQATNAANDPQSRNALAEEVDNIKATLVGQANTKFMDRPVFGGTTPGSAAYSTDSTTGEITFDGNKNQTTRTVGPNAKVRIEISGPEAFGEPGTDTELFTVLSQISKQIKDGDTDGLQTSLENLDTAHGLLKSALSDVGARYNRVEQMKQSADDHLLSVSSQLSDIEDVDLPKAIMELQIQQTSYQAALAATAKVIQPSLIDFLR